MQEINSFDSSVVQSQPDLREQTLIVFLKRTDSVKGNTSGEGSELEFQLVGVEGENFL